MTKSKTEKYREKTALEAALATPAEPAPTAREVVVCNNLDHAEFKTILICTDCGLPMEQPANPEGDSSVEACEPVRLCATPECKVPEHYSTPAAETDEGESK
jgi:hypothetical protein